MEQIFYFDLAYNTLWMLIRFSKYQLFTILLLLGKCHKIRKIKLAVYCFVNFVLRYLESIHLGCCDHEHLHQFPSIVVLQRYVMLA